MSDRSGGFFSSVGRFFSGSRGRESTQQSSSPSSPVGTSSTSSPRSPLNAGSAFIKDIISLDSQTETSFSPKKTGSSLRYLSPTVLDVSTRRDRALIGLDSGVEPASDIFSLPSTTTNKKRQLTETDRTLFSKTFRSESKRARFSNRSLMEPNLVQTLVPSRLDTTWCGEFSSAPSPASSVTNFSLLSRRSVANSNGSNLSSRTQQLLKKLENANTPAKDVQRMTMIRAGLSRPERWATSSTSGSFTSDAPPLRKAGDNVPSRIQLLSKTMALTNQKKPYWRDLTRKRSESKNDEQSSGLLSTVQSNGSDTTLSSLFATDSTKKSSTGLQKKHQSSFKGFDGKSVGRNTFKLNEDDIPPIPEDYLLKAKPLPISAAPPKEFLGKLSFSFAPPADLVNAVAKKPEPVKLAAPVVIVESEKDEESDSNDSDSSVSNKEADSGSDSSSEEKSSDSSDNEVSSESEKEVKLTKLPEAQDSRPQTSTDTISPAVSLESSKNNSPKVAQVAVPEVKKPAAPASAKWECDGCFTSWPETVNDCGCCGQKKGGSADNSAPAQKTLVSNLSSFASAKPATVSFGFGASSITSSAAAPILFGTGTTATSNTLFGAPKPVEVKAPAAPVVVSAPAPIVAPAPVAAPAASSDRVAWDCPECMVNNKATDDRCVCCQYVKYKSADSSSSNNVFGDRAFKPAATTGSGFSFGTGSATAPKFGFGGSDEKKTEAAIPATTTISFGTSVPSLDAPKPSLFGTSSSKPTETLPTAPPAPEKSVSSLFGSTFGAPKPDAPNSGLFGLAAPAAVPEKREAPLFGTLSGSLVAPAAVPEKKDAPLFGTLSASLGAPAPALVPEKKEAPLFGTSTGLFGSSAPVTKPAETTPAPSVLSFGSAASTAPTTEAPKASLFGNLAPVSSTAPTATPSLFGQSTTSSIFGNAAETQAPSLFGSSSDAGVTTTDGGPAKKMFAPAAETKPAPSLSFGTDKPAAVNSPFQFGSANTIGLFGQPATGMFGQPASTTSSIPAFGSTTSTTVPAFGSTPATTVPAFGSTTTSTVPAFGASSSIGLSFASNPAVSAAPAFGVPSSKPLFGSSTTTTAPAFGSFGSTLTAPPLPKPTISNSSSTSSLFNPAASEANPFQMNATPSSNGFAFGAQSNANGGSVFKFGSTAPVPSIPATSNGPAFVFGASGAPTLPAPPSMGGMENAFAYQPSQSQGARKMATARRRANLRK